MNEKPISYELSIDSEEAQHLLYGVLMICEGGEEWYDYDEEAMPAPLSPMVPPTPRLPADS